MSNRESDYYYQDLIRDRDDEIERLEKINDELHKELEKLKSFIKNLYDKILSEK